MKTSTFQCGLNMSLRNIRFIIILLSVLFITGCESHKKSGAKPVVTVTIEPYKYFVESIAGDKVSVQTLVPQGSNPETYEPTARQMMQLSESAVYIKVGNLGFERSWMQRIKDNAPNTVITDSSKGVKIKKSDDGHNDPHVWMSVKNARIIAKNIYEALLSVSREDSIYLKNRYTTFADKLDLLDKMMDGKLKSAKKRPFLIYHPMLTYLSDDYGLTQISLEQEGSEPSASQLKDIIAKAKSKRVQVILVQKEFNNRNVEVVAKSLGITVRKINPLGYDWYQNMIDISEQLR